MNRYRIGFAMYSGKGFATHNMNLYKYAQRDPEIDMVWATIGAGELPKKYQPFPRFVGTQLALIDEAAPLLKQWDELLRPTAGYQPTGLVRLPYQPCITPRTAQLRRTVLGSAACRSLHPLLQLGTRDDSP